MQSVRSRATDTNFTPLRLQQLVAEKRIVRILQPDLQERLRLSLRQPRRHPNIIQYHDQIYLSLHTLRSAQEREAAFSCLRRLQLGESVDLMGLPGSLRRLLNPNGDAASRKITHFSISLAMGVLVGMMAMAMGVLALTMAGVSMETPTGLQLSAIIFVLGMLVGWSMAAAVLWMRTRGKRNGR